MSDGHLHSAGTSTNSDGNDSASAQADQARSLLSRGEAERAKQLVLLAVEADPLVAELWHLLGQACAEVGDKRGAIEAYRAAVRVEPEESQWHFRLGLMYERSGNLLAAIRSHEDATAIPGSPTRYWYYLGRASERAGDWRKAAYAYHRYARKLRGPGRSPYRHEGGLLDFPRGIRFGVASRPPYAYGVYRACLLAARLGVDEISAVEFGVASGRGLLQLESYATTCTELTGVRVAVFGLDTGTGLPAPVDHRDLPHYFQPGDYAMEPEALMSRLQHARLVTGDAATTFPALLDEGIPPIGAMLFDMDLYTSTAGVLRSVGDGAEEAAFLPRPTVHFDDLVPKRPNEWLKDYGDVSGEALAIAEFNQENNATTLSEDRYFAGTPESYWWHDAMFLLHRTRHPAYEKAVSEPKPDRLRLQSRDEHGD